MATFKDIERFFNSLESDFARRAVPRIIAEKATEYYKQRFTSKEWDGNPWPATKKTVQRGSLMIRTSKLVNSIKPSVVSEQRVVISAGSGKVPYAKIHNEGGDISHPGGTSYFFSKKQNKAVFVKNSSAEKYRGIFNHALPVTKPHKITIPKRQYMGHTSKLNKIFMDSFRAAFKDLF